MDVIIIAGLIAVVLICAITMELRSETKKFRIWIRNHYGKKPEHRELDMERIAVYWREYGAQIPETEKIDEVTWNDLDMDHVYARINSCYSFAGEQTLYGMLHQTNKKEADRQKIAQKIRFYEEYEEEREETQLLLLKLGKEEGNYYIPRFIKNLEMLRTDNIWMYRLLLLLLILSFFPALIFRDGNLLLLPIVIFVFNMAVYGIKKTQYEISLDMLSGIIRIAKMAGSVADSSKLEYDKEFDEFGRLAGEFRPMLRMMGRIQKKRQVSMAGDFTALIYDYIVGATFIDFIQYDRIVRIMQNKEAQFMELYRVIGEMDAAIAAGSYRKSLPFYCEPEFTRKAKIQMEQLYHPLIDEPVCNSLNLSRNCIITGSNASGKSTFIKAVMVNLITANSIYTCMAERMTVPEARIITSMAVRDNLMSGESYYIKEIKYLNRIVQSMDNNTLVICAIDEILRGTNTKERIAASAAILDYLADRNCLAMVASHDAELTRLLADRYDCYYFREQIEENDIVFEYKIHRGVSKSTNAIRLLAYVNFPEKIIQDAKRHADIR